MRVALLLVLPAVLACGGAPAQPASSAAAEASPAEGPSAAPTSPPVIERAVLDEVLAVGIGSFLRTLETEPHLEGGEFVGFRFAAFLSPIYDRVDVRVGDTLLRINGQHIERPEHATAVWELLREATELRLELLRDGGPHVVVIPIAE